jgi:hypothetical protein
MLITTEERNMLRHLASEVAEIAELPIHETTRQLWKRLNGLDPERPMIGIDQICWQEINVDDELTIRSRNEFAVQLETDLRKTLYRWKHMKADMVIEKHIDVPKAIRNTGFGVKTNEEVASYDPNNPVKGHRYIDQLVTPEDLEKIQTPRIQLDSLITEEREQTSREIFNGILDVRMTGMVSSFAPWDRIVQWHGVESSIMDLVDRPEFIHALMKRFSDAHMNMLDQLEEQGLLAYNLPTIHCTGAYTDDLPSARFDPEKPTAKDTWTSGMAQIFATVSPAMHDEFEIEYAIPWYRRFGLGYYGCCEPLHDKIHIIERLPGVRKFL